MNERSIFLEALDKDGTDRAAYLDAMCAGNAEWRQQAEALLQEHAVAGSFLEVPAIERHEADPRAGREPTSATQREPPSADDESDLRSLLTPSTRPDSLGRLAHYEV